MDPDIALGSSLGPDNTMAPCGSAGHPNHFVPNGSMTLRPQQGHRFWPRHWTSMRPLVAPQARDITDPNYVRTADLKAALSCSLGLDDTMSPRGIEGHSDLYVTLAVA